MTRSKAGIIKPKSLPSDFVSHFTTTYPLIYLFASFIEPKTYKTTCKGPKWIQVMLEEFTVLVANGTWELVPYDPYLNTLGCKRVYRTKLLSNGAVDRFKAIL